MMKAAVHFVRPGNLSTICHKELEIVVHITSEQGKETCLDCKRKLGTAYKNAKRRAHAI